MGTARACAVAEALGGELYATWINLACWHLLLLLWCSQHVAVCTRGRLHKHSSGLWRRDRNIKHSRLHGTWYGGAFQSIGVLAYKHVQNVTDTVTTRNSSMSHTTFFEISESYPSDFAHNVQDQSLGDLASNVRAAWWRRKWWSEHCSLCAWQLPLCDLDFWQPDFPLCKLTMCLVCCVFAWAWCTSKRILTFPTRSEVGMRWTAWNAAWIV